MPVSHNALVLFVLSALALFSSVSADQQHSGHGHNHNHNEIAARSNSEREVAKRSYWNPSFPGCQGKRGLAWSNHEAGAIEEFAHSNVCFIYDWDVKLQYGMKVPKGMYFIPQLWGPKDAAEFQRTVKKGYAKYAAGFNEPDISSQSHMSPQYGASLWNKYFCPLKGKGYTLISPAPAIDSSWLKQFKKYINPACMWDITAAHIYTTDAQAFKKAAIAYHDAFGKPVMITEFACHDYSGRDQQSNSKQVMTFMKDVMAFMDNDNRFVGYAWFAPMTGSELEANNVNPANALIHSGGNMTALGSFYKYVVF